MKRVLSFLSIFSIMNTSKILMVFLLIFGFQISANSQSATQVNLGGSNTTNQLTNNVAKVVDSTITVTANGTISGFVVSITGSYTNGDVLSYTGTLPSGVSAAAFNTSTKSLVFSGTTTAANWQALLRTVTLRTTSATCNPESRKVSFTFNDKYYNPINGHFYEYYSTTGSWTAALAASSTKSYFGRKCYIATLTTTSENSFVNALIGQNTWLGCSDNYLQINAALGYTAYTSQSSADGNFYWVTGPERGTKISSKNAWASGGITPVSGIYNNWNNNEPNDWPGQNNSSPGEEDYGHMYSSTGKWNDFANTQNIGTIFEYGGMPTDSVTSNVVFTRNITINSINSGTITGGNVTVCSGSNSTTLTLSGLVGTVVSWQSSNDNFVTNVNTIINTTTSLTVTNLTSTTYYRANVSTVSGGCYNLSTSPVVINVNATVPGVIVANNNTICRYGDAEFTLYGNVGNVTKWQKSNNSNFTSGVVDITNTSNFMSYQLNSTGTYYFRAFVQEASCGSAVPTPSYSISVVTGTNPVGGTVTSTQHCGGSSNSGTLTLSGHTGSVSRWEYSTDGGSVWINVSNTTTTLNYSGVGSNRMYRALLVNGSCGSSYSDIGTVTVFGSTITRWDGGVSSDWQNASNWCGGVADNGIDILFNSSSSNPLVLDQDRIVGNIDFNGQSTSITLGNNNLTVGNLTDAGSNAYFVTNGSGSLKMNIADGSSKTYPIGSASYNPLKITNNTGSSDYISVRVFDEVYNNGFSGWVATNLGRVKRTWDIHKTNANAGAGLDMVFYWNLTDIAGLAFPALYHYENNTWNKLTGSYSFGTTSLSYTGYTGTFSPFAISNSITPLPVELFNFDAIKSSVNNDVDVRWSAIEDMNFDRYELMKSTDGANWETIYAVEKAENSNNSVNQYLFTDNSSAAKTFYKLKMLDYNGEFKYSKIVQVNNQLKLNEQILMYPNPSTSFVEFVIKDQTAEYSIVDINGKTIRTGQFFDNCKINNLETGLYIVTFTVDGNVYHQKLVVE